MRRVLACLCVCLQLVSLFSVNIFAYTVDDIRDLLGKERVDDKFTQEEIDTVIQQYNSIEQKNMILQLYDIGKEINIDEDLLEEYDALEKELESAVDIFANDFEGGAPLSDVLISKSKVESILHKIDSLKDIGYDFDTEYVPNIWTEKYEEVQEVVKEMSTYYDIGEVGKNMKVPYLGTFYIYSPFGPRLNKFTYDSVEKHNGIDFDVPIDTMVLAQWNGIVSKIYTTEQGGKIVEISHGDNLKTVYGHMGEISVVVGEKVSQYEAIGKTGNTGKMVTPHLHFEVILDGEYVNPIYLYGTEGLQAFKVYASKYASASSQISEIEKNLKNEPTKVVEEKPEKDSGLVLYVEVDGFTRDKFHENFYKDDEDEGIIEGSENESIENNSD